VGGRSPNLAKYRDIARDHGETARYRLSDRQPEALRFGRLQQQVGATVQRRQDSSWQERKGNEGSAIRQKAGFVVQFRRDLRPNPDKTHQFAFSTEVHNDLHENVKSLALCGASHVQQLGYAFNRRTQQPVQFPVAFRVGLTIKLRVDRVMHHASTLRIDQSVLY
jgi:hypothetical protein